MIAKCCVVGEDIETSNIILTKYAFALNVGRETRSAAARAFCAAVLNIFCFHTLRRAKETVTVVIFEPDCYSDVLKTTLHALSELVMAFWDWE